MPTPAPSAFLSVCLVVFGLMGLVAAPACKKSDSGGSSSTPTTPTTPNTPSTPTTPTAGASWVSEGVRLTNAQVGFSGVLADTSTIQLKDGRWRMFMFAGDAYRSAVSSDGLSFTMEDGTRLPSGSGHIRVLRLADDRVRAYFISRNGISSAISSDEGLTFVTEDGERVNAGSFGASQLSGCSIARLRDGTYRMYFSDLPIPGAGVQPHRTFSASSADLLNWTPDSGVRIGPGAATLTNAAEHPSAFANSDGSISLFYFRNSNLAMMTSTAADGLTFTTESNTGLTQANDPDVVRVGGSLRMYYNWGDNTSGAIYSASRASSDANAQWLVAPARRIPAVLPNGPQIQRHDDLAVPEKQPIPRQRRWSPRD
jgi:hypothetical protein